MGWLSLWKIKESTRHYDGVQAPPARLSLSPARSASTVTHNRRHCKPCVFLSCKETANGGLRSEHPQEKQGKGGRVFSTQRQGSLGLGMEVQRSAVAYFAEQEGSTEITEVETGKGADALDRRPLPQRRSQRGRSVVLSSCKARRQARLSVHRRPNGKWAPFIVAGPPLAIAPSRPFEFLARH